MSWNQAWSVWNALQIAKTRQEDYLKGAQNNQLNLQQQILSAQQRSPLMAGFLRLMEFATPLAQRFSQMVTGSLNSMVRGVQTAQSVVRALAQSLLPNINITDKLATILGDGKKLLDDVFHQNVESLKSLHARFQFAERLAQVGQMMEKAMEALASEAAQWIHEAGEKAQRVLEKIKRWFKTEPQHLKQKRHTQK